MTQKDTDGKDEKQQPINITIAPSASLQPQPAAHSVLPSSG